MSRSWPFLDHDGPIAFAHRGGAGDAPENSLEAFRSAVDMGFSHLETDVHLSADGRLVAFHDDRLDRVTDAKGRVAELPFAEISRARIEGTARIVLLEELLEELPESRINIDPKHDAAVEPLADLIKSMGVVDRVCVGSFSTRRTVRISQLVGPRLCTALGRGGVARLRLGASWPRSRGLGAVCAQVPVQSGPVPIVTRAFVERAHAMGKVVHVWTVDEPGEMHRLLDLGVDGLMTDRPRALKAVLEERGEWRR